jgi:hypothetical protein
MVFLSFSLTDDWREYHTYPFLVNSQAQLCAVLLVSCRSGFCTLGKEIYCEGHKERKGKRLWRAGGFCDSFEGGRG